MLAKAFHQRSCVKSSQQVFRASALRVEFTIAAMRERFLHLSPPAMDSISSSSSELERWPPTPSLGEIGIFSAKGLGRSVGVGTLDSSSETGCRPDGGVPPMGSGRGMLPTLARN